MMVFKSFSCSLDCPKPNHRPCGDIDIWLFGDQKKADELIKEKGSKVDNSHHHHTVFYWNGFMVENFVNVHAHQSSKELEVYLSNLARMIRISLSWRAPKCICRLQTFMPFSFCVIW